MRASVGSCPSGYTNRGGTPATTDCNDANGAIRPLATEVCNTIDDDCDASTDEGATTAYFRDADGDGFGAGAATNACTAPTGYVPTSTDCDDTRASSSPVGTEVCDASLRDEDCDSTANEGCACVDGTSRACGGGSPVRGVCRAGTQLCIAGAWATCSGNVDPGTVTETCNGLDDDCDGSTDESLLAASCYVDADSDGYGSGSALATLCRDASRAAFGDCPSGYTNVGGTAATRDCNDANGAIRPLAAEVCNTTDDDCDGMIDEGATTSYYRDADGDGFGAGSATSACAAPTGYVTTATDCDDTRGNVSPAGAEVCDATMRDEDCDSTANEGCACVDGTSRACGGGSPIRGVCRAGTQLCIAGAWATCSGNIDPGTVTETCNGLDDDCDGSTDETLLAASCYVDTDSDGYGAGAVVTSLCADPARSSVGNCPSGYTNVGGTTATRDCNDENAAIRPGAAEVCDAGLIDDDCDGTVNEGCACVNGAVRTCGGGTSPGVGICRSGTQRCLSGAWLACEGNVDPAASETCNGLDDDCDGSVDEGVTVTVYTDADGDTYGVGAGFTACSAATGLATRAGDCNDANAAVRPGGTEICNDVDDDCDASVDEGFGCRIGATQSCTTPCGTTGSQTCTSLCAFSTCRTSDEGPSVAGTCNSCDDDADGRIDENFECARSTIVPCERTSSPYPQICRVAGQRVCGASCTFLNPECVATSETCNGCDDDGDGTAEDDLLASSGDDAVRPFGCTTLSIRPAYTPPAMIGGGCTGQTCCDRTIGFPSGLPTANSRARLVNGAGQAGAAWHTVSPSIGYGTYSVSVEMNSVTLSGAIPADGWAVVLSPVAENSDGSNALGAGAANLGVPRNRASVSVEWRFYSGGAFPGAAGSCGLPDCSPDEVVVYANSAGGVQTELGRATVPAAYSLEAGAVGRTQRLVIDYTPPNEVLGRTRRLTVRLNVGDTVPLIDISDGLTGIGTALSPLNVGVTAGTGSSFGFSTFGFRGEVNLFATSSATWIRPGNSCIADGTPIIEGGGSAGRLLVWRGGQFGSVCNDSFTSVAATVACKQLGYTGGTFDSPGIYPADSTPIWLDDVVCDSGDATLAQCDHRPWGAHNCTHPEDVRISCF
jgi:hypothetical protein